MLLKKKREFENKVGKENISIQITHKKQEYHVKRKLMLPKEILYKVFLFLTPKELHHNVRPLSYLYMQLFNQHFWNYYNNFNKLSFDDLYSKCKFLQERRSKGKLYCVQNKLTDEQFMIRELDTIKANANHMDGLQTSILREISYMKSIKSHPNIGQIVDVQVKNHIVSIVYEYYQRNLRDCIRISEFSLDQIKQIFLQICLGMEYLHQNHIIHRNLKPDNIFLENKMVKICDFALARLETFPIIPYTPEDPKERERSNREMKRLWYRAPEMLLRKQYYSCEIDSWSLGCILAEMALRSPLFSGTTEIEYLFEVFQFLGSPEESDWNSISDNVKIKFPFWKKYSLCMKQLNQAQIMDLVRNRKQVFEKILTLNNILGDDGIDLLSKLLAIKPEQRIDIVQALEHPFLQSRSQNIKIFYQEPNFKLYLDFQIEITQTMRSTLIDWLIDVCLHFELLDETLHLAVIYLDLYLSQKLISKKELQLIGVTSLKIAEYLLFQFSVYNERSKEYFKQENCNAYAYITADEYNEQQIINMEQRILKLINYNLTFRTPIQYLKILNSKFQISQESQQLSYFYCDFLLLGYEQLSIHRQLYALCCLLLATYSLSEKFNYQMQYSIEDITDSLDRIYSCWQFIKLSPQINSLDACMQRHKHLNPRDINLNIPSQEYLQQLF